jgi:hypothetical protein
MPDAAGTISTGGEAPNPRQSRGTFDTRHAIKKFIFRFDCRAKRESIPAKSLMVVKTDRDESQQNRILCRRKVANSIATSTAETSESESRHDAKSEPCYTTCVVEKKHAHATGGLFDIVNRNET